MINKTKELFNILHQYNYTISSVESFTGGLFSKVITDCPGSSSYFKGSIVSYSPLIKESVLNIEKKDIDKYGVVSKEICYQMMKNGKSILDSDICVSFTGNAGPGVDIDKKPKGLVFVGIYSNSFYKIYKIQFKDSFSRSEIREYSVEFIIKKLIKLLKNKN